MSEKAKIIVTIFSLFSGLCSGELHTKDIFSSMSDMENLFEMEPKITEKVENFIQLLDSQIDSLDSYLDKHYKVIHNNKIMTSIKSNFLIKMCKKSANENTKFYFELFIFQSINI